MNPTRTSTTLVRVAVGAGRGFIVLALALGALLFTLSAPVAHAAPPEVTTPDNPVMIPYSQDTKEITLKWTLAALQLAATLTVTESGTPAPVLDQVVFSTPDTTKLTVTYGKTYTAQLKDAGSQQPIGAPLIITTARLDIKFDPGCLVQCITSADPMPPPYGVHGGWAQFDIKTSVPAIITLEASKTKPNANGKWSVRGAVAASSATILPTQDWKPPLPDLDSNTTYYYVVRAHDGNGNEQFKTGSFKTLTRRVEVNFAEIEMIDDSDGPDCECWFWFNAGDETPKPYGDFSDPKSIASGTTVHPNVSFTITNAPSEIWIRAMGYDDDVDWGSFCSESGGYLPYTGHASWLSASDVDGCLQESGNQAVVSVSRQGEPAAPDEVDEEFTEKFTISPGLGLPEFKVHGTYKVTYVS
jgi:hypothetical protein